MFINLNEETEQITRCKVSNQIRSPCEDSEYNKTVRLVTTLDNFASTINEQCFKNKINLLVL